MQVAYGLRAVRAVELIDSQQEGDQVCERMKSALAEVSAMFR